MAHLDYNDISRLVRYAERTAQKSAKKIKTDELLLPRYLYHLGGVERCDKARTRGKQDICYNGGFEYSLSLDINPVGWSFTNAYGVVLDYDYQPADSSAEWTSGTATNPTAVGALNIGDFYYRTSSVSTNSVYMINGTPQNSYQFEGPLAESIDGSHKFCVVQSRSSDDFSANLHIPKGSLVGGSVYYLDFCVAPFGGYLPEIFIQENWSANVTTGTHNILLNPAYVTSQGNYFVPFYSHNSGVIVGVEPKLTFFDSLGNEVAEYTGDKISLAAGVGWANPTFIFVAPETATACTVSFESETVGEDLPVSFIVDNVSVYKENTNQRTGSIETHAVSVTSPAPGRYVSCLTPRSGAYLYGVRALYSGVNRDSYTCDLDITLDRVAQSDEYGYLRPDINRLDRGYLSVGKYIPPGTEVGVQVIRGTDSFVKLYFDFSTV